VAYKLLGSAPKLRILTTSREPLGVLGETIFDVAPLSLEPIGGQDALGGDVNGSEAMELFEARVTAVQPEFVMDSPTRRAIAELCELLDGIPLAIELAAFQVRSFPVTQILARHEFVFDMLNRGNRAGPHRHQTLQGTLEWSYSLCTAGQRTLWERLSVFTGSFDVDAVKSVCGGAADGLDVLEHFPRLVEKSIVVRVGSGADTRYRLLESIKHFGAAKLSEHDDAGVWHGRHRDHYLRVAVLGEQHTNGPDQVEWNKRLQDDFPNIRSALDYCLNIESEYAAGLRMAGSLWFFWNASGHLRDGRHWLGRALDVNPEPSRDRAKALWAIGWYAMVQGDAEAADRYFQECIELAEHTGDDHAHACALQFQGTTAQIRGDLGSARNLLVDAMDRHRKAGHIDVLTILCGAQLSFVYCVLGEDGEALDHADTAIALGRRRGESFATSWAVWTRGLVAWSKGEFEDAAVTLREAIVLKRSLRDWLGTSACVELLSWLAVEAGDHSRAALLLGIGRGLCGELGSSPLFGDVTLTETRERYELAASDVLGEPAFDKEVAAGEALGHERAIAYVFTENVTAEESRSTPDVLLTRRQIEVVQHVVAGMSNKEIAQTLVISRRTVEGHVERALVKTGFRSRSQLAAWFAKEHRLEY
jgi:non-specific serine/threonine protein kinase